MIISPVKGALISKSKRFLFSGVKRLFHLVWGQERVAWGLPTSPASNTVNFQFIFCISHEYIVLALTSFCLTCLIDSTLDRSFGVKMFVRNASVGIFLRRSTKPKFDAVSLFFLASYHSEIIDCPTVV